MTRGRNSSKFILQAGIILITKVDKDDTRKLQTNIPDEHRCKNPQQNNSKLNSTIHLKEKKEKIYIYI